MSTNQGELSSRQHRQKRDPLKRLISKNAKTRARALQSLAETNHPGPIQQAVSMLSDRSSLVRVTAVEIIGELGNRVHAGHLIDVLTDANAEVRMRAAEAIGGLLKNDRCPSALVKLLRDPDELVRVAAAESLETIGDRCALRALLRALKDTSPLVRGYAADAIGQVGTRKNLPALKAALERETSDISKVGLDRALYQLGEHKVLNDLLILLSESPDYRARCAAANSLSRTPLTPSDRAIALRHLQETLRNEPTAAVKSSIQSTVRFLRTCASS